MDHNTTIYTVRLYTGTNPIERPGERLAVFNWKERKVKNEAGVVTSTIPAISARCVSIPRIALTVQPAVLAIALQDAWEGMQDATIRAWIETQLAAKNEALNLSSADIDPAAVATHMQEQASSGHLSTDAIKAFWDTTLSDALALALGEKMQITEHSDAATTARYTNALRSHYDLLVTLSSPRTNMQPATATQLKKAVQLIPLASNRTAEQLCARLDKFIAPKQVVTLEEIL